MAALCDPCHPAVLRVLKRTIGRCIRKGKPVTLCGEMAGRPLCLLPLLGMGLRQASMSPAFVPAVKELVRSISTVDARRVAKAVLRMETVAEVRAYLGERLRKLCRSGTHTTCFTEKGFVAQVSNRLKPRTTNCLCLLLLLPLLST